MSAWLLLFSSRFPCRPCIAKAFCDPSSLACLRSSSSEERFCAWICAWRRIHCWLRGRLHPGAPDSRNSARLCPSHEISVAHSEGNSSHSDGWSAITCKTVMCQTLWSCDVPQHKPWLFKDACAYAAASCDAALLSLGSGYVACHSQTPYRWT